MYRILDILNWRFLYEKIISDVLMLRNPPLLQIWDKQGGVLKKTKNKWSKFSPAAGENTIFGRFRGGLIVFSMRRNIFCAVGHEFPSTNSVV